MIISDAAEMFVMALCVFGETAAAAGFCRRILGTSKIKRVLFIALLFSMTVILAMLCGRCQDINFIFRLLYHIIFIGLALFLFEADMEKKILAAAILMTVRRFVCGFFLALFSYMTLVFLHVIKKEPLPVLDANSTCCYMMICIAYAAEIGSILLLSKRCAAVFDDGKIRKWYMITAVPLFMLIVLADVAEWGAERGIMVRSGGNFNLYHDQLFSYGANCIFSLLSLSAAGFYVFGMNRIYSEKRQKEYYYARVAAYQMLDEQYRKMERLRHDLRNHVIALQGFLEKKEPESMKSYLQQMMKAADMEKSEEVTGNTAVDALLYRKKRLAEEKGISWKCDMRIPADCPVGTYDLCVLLGNLLDNAIEACERMPEHEKHFIMISSKMVKKCFLLEIKNSTNMQDIKETEYSRKREQKESGIGLLTIKDVVHRYYGTMSIELEKGIFGLSILVPSRVVSAE